jgi:hypothetical protein
LALVWVEEEEVHELAAVSDLTEPNAIGGNDFRFLCCADDPSPCGEIDNPRAEPGIGEVLGDRKGLIDDNGRGLLFLLLLLLDLPLMS